MKKQRVGMFFGILCALAVALGGCGAQSGNQTGGQTASTEGAGDKTGGSAQDTSTITIGLIQDLDSMDPMFAESAATRAVLFNVYEGLVKPDPDGNLNPAIASEYAISEDGATYSFTLREGVKFHNGNTVTAEDVKYSLERYANATAGGTLVSALAAVDHVDIVDDTHVDVVLKEGDADFLAYLMIGIVPADVTDHEAQPVGTGPYQFVSRSPSENVIFEKFDDYWDKEQAAHIQNVVFKYTPSIDSVALELEGGTLDMFYKLPAAQASSLSDSFQVYEGTMNIAQALYINNAEKPFDDVRVRQALCYAIDPQTIMDFVSEGAGTEIGSAMYPAFRKYYDPAWNDTYNQDIEKAKALLAEAGYPGGFSFTIRVSSSHPQHVDTSQVLAEQLKEIGVNVTIEQIEWQNWLKEVYSDRQYQATVVGIDASALNAPSMLARYETGASKNMVNFSDKTFDETYQKARASTDDAEKTTLYKDCLRILSEEAASVYIQDLPNFVALNKKFTGYEYYPLYAENIALIRPAE